jgi:hypothetical protein
VSLNVSLNVSLTGVYLTRLLVGAPLPRFRALVSRLPVNIPVEQDVDAGQFDCV